MGVFNSLNETSNKAVDLSEQFYQKTQEYYKLKVFHQLSLTTGMFCKMAILGSLGFLGLLFFSVAGTIFLGEILDSLVLSCLIIGALFFVIVTILYKTRKRIDNFIVKKLSAKFFT
ncbi:hypothetical protein J8L85_15955 [Maribacter sp. MMG018]|uniref:hypothetical protein n=1 Tax=Maribacter sp. MMG018 TaxID=2822688 RepID=UPI001B392727|nr:hypothetical protein [Maribacter sp. MMG018]MBQ4915950.1 hypothetical protein [Maribacter sp. MMG018]